MGGEESKARKAAEKAAAGTVPRSYAEFSAQVAEVARLASRLVDPKDHCTLAFLVEPTAEDKLQFKPLWKDSTFVVVTKFPTLPPRWECRLDGSGRAFFINHAARTTQWEPPWAIPYPPVLQSPPLDMVKRLSVKQWAWAYAKIRDACGELLSRAPSPPAIAVPSPAAAANAAAPGSPVAVPQGRLEDDDDAQVCVVCMERKPKVVLACTHAFCTQCLSQWKGKSDTCPLCRASVSKTEDESWVLAGAATDEEIAGYVAQFIDTAASLKP